MATTPRPSSAVVAARNMRPPKEEDWLYLMATVLPNVGPAAAVMPAIWWGLLGAVSSRRGVDTLPGRFVAACRLIDAGHEDSGWAHIFALASLPHVYGPAVVAMQFRTVRQTHASVVAECAELAADRDAVRHKNTDLLVQMGVIECERDEAEAYARELADQNAVLQQELADAVAQLQRELADARRKTAAANTVAIGLARKMQGNG